MAASSTAVTVLTPNGRRQTVKVSPNTPLLQVLEDVCKKHGFNPDDHGLKFQRNVLDLSLQWRFASLPNNAKLEVVPSIRKQAAADSQVRIALQMEDGSRLQGSFSCGQSLWDLLTHFPQTRVSELLESGSTPVCVYMRDEVSGEAALKRASLKSLGLTGGSAIVRFSIKKTKTPESGDDGERMDTAAIPTSPSDQDVKPDPRPPADLPSKPDMPTTEVPIIKPDLDRLVEPPPAQAPASVTSVLPVKQEVDTVPSHLNDVRPKASSSGAMKQEEDGEKAGPSGLNSAHLCSSYSSPPSAPFIPFSGGGQRLGGPGAGGPTLSSSSSSSSSLSSLATSGGPPKAKKAKPSHDYKVKSSVSQHGGHEDDKEFLEPVEREALVYHLDVGTRRHDDEHDLPDEFFEVTMDDVRKRFAQLKSERKVYEEAPLMTKALREAQVKEKIDRYPKVVLRVQFPDRRVLQGFFRPLETVADLRRFVKAHLEDPRLNFYLFIAPPKTILDNPSATLFQANLFPAALVYFGSDVKTDVYLQQGLVDSSVSALQADESIAGCIPSSSGPSTSSFSSEDLFPPPEPEVQGAEQDDHSPNANNQAPKPARTDPGKVPKWLKLPGKK